MARRCPVRSSRTSCSSRSTTRSSTASSPRWSARPARISPTRCRASRSRRPIRSARSSRDVYGYDPLGYQATELPRRDEKYFAKLDWNITPGHRATISYQQTKGSQIQSSGNTLTGTSASLGLLSQWIERQNNLWVYKGQVFSDWTDNFSTELSASYKKMDNPGYPLAGSDFAQFRVYLGGAASGPSVYAGTNASYQANELTTYLQQYRAKATYTAGSHRITAGYELEKLRIWDLFVQNANGAYVFNSIADLQARQASSVAYANAATNNKADAGFTFHTTTHTLYLQDEWAVLPNFTIKAGVRYDLFKQSDHPVENPVVVQRYGISNAANLDGKSIFQPRIGFNWKPDGATMIYGGVGLFGGGSPTVWTAKHLLQYRPGSRERQLHAQRHGVAAAASRRPQQCRWQDRQPVAQGSQHRRRQPGPGPDQRARQGFQAAVLVEDVDRRPA